MNPISAPAEFIFDANTNTFLCKGDWSILYIDSLKNQLEKTQIPKTNFIKINGSELKYFDSAAAILLLNFINKLPENMEVIIEDFNDHLELFELVKNKLKSLNYVPEETPKLGFLAALGKEAMIKLKQMDGLIILIGSLTDKLYHACVDWKRFQFPTIVSTIYHSGITALPIIALLSFLIGVVLAYQMGIQLETYGANIFIAYLSGMAIFREFGPLITAIIAAGRTSSSFTAQIGSMKINEEIDALLTMGLSPIELIVVPKVIGLLIVFPLLIFWSDIFSTLGAMYMSKFQLNISYLDFLDRLRDSVGLKQLLLGLYKAPAFAILIGLVGCFQGFQVGTSSDSVGIQTTKSVVQALFLIIIADSIYSIIYSWLDI